MPSQTDLPTASSATTSISSSTSTSTSTSSLPKHTKLRESCDSCLIAKVKCSKTRPLCARCLANGAPCGYSPSSRAGRKNRNAGLRKAAASNTAPKDGMELPQSALPNATSYLPLFMYPMLEPNGDHNPTIWGGSTSPTTQEDQQGPQSVAEKGIITTKQGDSYDTSDFLPTPPLNGDFMDSFVPLSSHHGFSAFATAAPSPNGNADQAPVSPAWTINNNQYSLLPSFQSPLDLMPVGHAHSSHPAMRPALPRQQENNQNLAQPGPGSDCDCFASCLHALQSLHNHSWMSSSTHQGGPPFDIVLKINREAIDGCSALLGCDNCVPKIGGSITTMLLATIFGKVMSLYRATCMFRFGSSTGVQASAQLAFGAYTVTGEDRQLLEIEILLLELRKVESILSMYQDGLRNAPSEQNESSLYTALTSYLDKNLHYIVDFLQVRKGESSK